MSYVDARLEELEPEIPPSVADEIAWDFPDKLAFLFESHRYKVAYGGRGGAKSWGFARALLIEGAAKPLRVLCAREVQKSIKDSVHKLLSDQVDALKLDGDYKVNQNEIRGKYGSEFIFTGLSDQTSDSIKSFEGIDVVWVEEAHKVSRRSWDILLPTIRKESSEIWLSLNPELDTDETYVRFVENPPEGAKVVFMSYRDNPWFPEVLEKERLEFLKMVSKGLRSQDDYDNIWEGKCRAAVQGAIYAQEIGQLRHDRRYCRVKYDPILPVHCVWDLGWNDAMVVGMWQRSPQGLMLIDSLVTSHTKYSDVVASLNSRGYRWGKDFLPHDGKHKNPQTGESAEILLKRLGRDVYLVPDVGLEAGIKAVRQAFGKIWIDNETGDNKAVINGLKRYKRVISATTNEPGSPLHDDASHACLTADSVVETSIGGRPIADVAVGDMVWTPAGYSRVICAGPVKVANRLVQIMLTSGSALTGTPEHKVLTSRGFICMDMISYSDRIYSGKEWQCVLIKLLSMVTNIGFRASITGETSGGPRGRQTYTERFGNTTMGRFLTTVTSTIKTAIHSTMIFPILSVSTLLNMPEPTPPNYAGSGNSSHRLNWLWKKPLSGTSLMRARNGTGKWPQKPGQGANGFYALVRNVASRFARLILSAPNGATKIAKLLHLESVGEQVYDLTVENHACYQANGALVSNSDMVRYAVVSADDMTTVSVIVDPYKGFRRAS